MRYLTLDEALILHGDIMQEMQGLKGFNKAQIGLLDSALTQIKNDDFYPEFLDKITHLMFACIKFHPFLDGNKRSAIYLANAFVEFNCSELLPNDFYQKLENVVVDVASDKINKDELKGLLKGILTAFSTNKPKGPKR